MSFNFPQGIPGIKMTIPRLRSNHAIIDAPKLIKATNIAPRKRIPNMEHLIPVPKADSVIMVEITPNTSNHNLNLFLSFEKIPTYRSFIFHTKVSELPTNDTLGENENLTQYFTISCVFRFPLLVFG